MICRHCEKRNANRHRGLCWSCYYKPGVRELYPSTSKYFPGNFTLDKLATCSLCGGLSGYSKSSRIGTITHKCATCKRLTAAREPYRARIAELEKRAELGLPLFDGPRPRHKVD